MNVLRTSGIEDGRSPRGERGLKFDIMGNDETHVESLSSRRAWIEIYGTPGRGVRLLPVALLAESVD